VCLIHDNHLVVEWIDSGILRDSFHDIAVEPVVIDVLVFDANHLVELLVDFGLFGA
jgi:hypothetical protein